jgi:hypothetical protein
MLQSYVIEFKGVFAGAAVQDTQSFRFVAVLPALFDLDQHEFTSLYEVKKAVSLRLHQERVPAVDYLEAH